jgi:hypothetical protein
MESHDQMKMLTEETPDSSTTALRQSYHESSGSKHEEWAKGIRIILPVVLYGCETWSLTLRDKHRLRVFENRVLSRISGPKRDEIRGEWRNLHNEELHNLYSFPDIIWQIKSRRMRWVRHVTRMREERKVYRVLMGKPEGRRPLERPRHRWEDGIRKDLRETGWKGGYKVNPVGSG